MRMGSSPSELALQSVCAEVAVIDAEPIDLR